MTSFKNWLPKKSLGQNFLVDQGAIQQIVNWVAPYLKTKHGSVLEIGPGKGSLTRPILSLLPQGWGFLGIEKDIRMEAGLAAWLTGEGRGYVLEDALNFEYGQWGTPPRVLLGNLPYNVSVPILLKTLRQGPAFQAIFFMFQKEVAQRIVASPGTKAYGRLSVMSQWSAHCQPLLDLPGSAFYPSPKVTSTVVKIIPRPFPGPLWPILAWVAESLFQHPRKMVAKNFQSLYMAIVKARQGAPGPLKEARQGFQWALGKEKGPCYNPEKMPSQGQRQGFSLSADHWMEALGVDPRSRPQDLGEEVLVRIAHLVVEDLIGVRS